MPNRQQPPAVWTTVVAQELAILLALGVIDIGLSDTINNLIVAVLHGELYPTARHIHRVSTGPIRRVASGYRAG